MRLGRRGTAKVTLHYSYTFQGSIFISETGMFIAIFYIPKAAFMAIPVMKEQRAPVMTEICGNM